MPTLIARKGPLAGRRFELDDEVVLGREDATITLADEETSRRHATIRVTAGVVVIEDLGSTNGTFVNGKRIDAATELSGGETIKLGQTVFDIEVEIVDAGATKMAPSPEPIADPERTAVSHRPPPTDPIAPPPEPVAPPPEPVVEPDPGRTALRPRPSAPEPELEPEPAASADPDLTRPRSRPEPEAGPPVADPDRTALRPRPPAPEAPPPKPIADPDRTALRPRPGREPVPSASAPPPPPRPPRAPARPARGVAPPAEQPFGAFAPPPGRKRGGIATRKLAPTLVSFATIITTAVALVIYFVGR